MDILADKFAEAMQKIKAINAPKSLIENGKFKKEFTANGVKYIVCPPDKIFNIDRQIAYHNIETAFSLNQTPTAIKQRFVNLWETIIRLMKATGVDWQKNMNDLLRDCMNNLDSFKGEFTSRYPAAYYICTLFIIREGEDLNGWSFDQADEKINDWTAENIRAVDFFGLALATSEQSQTIINEN